MSDDRIPSTSSYSQPVPTWNSYWSLDLVLGANFEKRISRNQDSVSPLGGVNITYGRVPPFADRTLGFGSSFQYFYGGQDNHYALTRPHISFQRSFIQLQLGPVLGFASKADLKYQDHLGFLTGGLAHLSLGVEDGRDPENLDHRINLIGIGGGLLVVPEAPADKEVSSVIQVQIHPLSIVMLMLLCADRCKKGEVEQDPFL